jgi:hypothetical protein
MDWRISIRPWVKAECRANLDVMHERILNRLSALLAKLEVVPCIKRSAGIA